MNRKQQGICLIGSTGSIGTQCLDIVRRNPERLRVAALCANRNVDLLARQALEFLPHAVAMADPSRAEALQCELDGTGIQVLGGNHGVCECAAMPEADIVLGAATGVAGLKPVLSALSAGKILALANKETLVAAGPLTMETARKHNARIIPVDSEHSAVFQCLEKGGARNVEKILLTASGGPFRNMDCADFERVTPAQALRHPNWNMGPKVTIDSSTMMNKGLEVIEAYWLFGVTEQQIEVVVHPQSIIHSMVLFRDGSVKAQLSLPDMRLPIQYALSYPDRWPFPEGRIDWTSSQSLDFHPPDLKRFPCLRLAMEALAAGGNASAVLNAANEAAVDLFLKEKLSFMEIPHRIEKALSALSGPVLNTYEEVLEIDHRTRRHVLEAVRRNTCTL